MKKTRFFATCLLLLCFCTGCTTNTTDTMQLANSSLSEEENNIIELLERNQSAQIYDFQLDESAKSLSLTSYELDETGSWQQISSSNLTLDSTSGRLAYHFDLIPNGIYLSIQDANGTTTSQNHTSDTVDREGMSVLTSYASLPISIVYDKEIPLALQVVSSNPNTTALSTDAFFTPSTLLPYQNEHVYAFTLSFSTALPS